jgi:hypothetical protein
MRRGAEHSPQQVQVTSPFGNFLFPLSQTDPHGNASLRSLAESKLMPLRLSAETACPNFVVEL